MIVYTCITNKIDPLHEPTYIMPNCTYLCFSETAWNSSIWQVKPLIKNFTSAILTARFHKIQAPLYLNDTKYLWQDGKIIMHDPTSLFEQLTDNFLFFEHPKRTCIYEEGKKIIELNKENKNKIKDQLNHYKKLKHITKQLFETCVFLINKNEQTIELLNNWWNEIETFSYRDQISLPFVLQNSELQYNCLKNPYNHPSFLVNHHSIPKHIAKLL